MRRAGMLLMLMPLVLSLILLGATGQLFETMIRVIFNLIMGGIFLIGFLLYKGEVG